MGILDDVVVNAKSAAEAVGRKAGQLVDASKLRITIAELNTEIRRCYEALGQYVAENCGEVLAGDEEAAAQLAVLEELKGQLAAVTRELGGKQNKVICPVCGKASPQSAAFCAACGTKLQSEEPQEEAPAEEPAETKEEE